MLEGGRRIAGRGGTLVREGGKTYLGVDEGSGEEEGRQDGHGSTHDWYWLVVCLGWGGGQARGGLM